MKLDMPYAIKNSNPKQTSRKALRLVMTFFMPPAKIVVIHEGASRGYRASFEQLQQKHCLFSTISMHPAF